MNFRSLAIEKGIDTAYTMCFSKNLKADVWKRPFINRNVNLLISVGYETI